MFGHFPASGVLGAILPVAMQSTVIVVLAMLATVLLLLVVALGRRMTLRFGSLQLTPRTDPLATPLKSNAAKFSRRMPPSSPRQPMQSAPDLANDSSFHSLAELARATERTPDPTQPFNLAAVAEAISASETMKAIEALRAVEARRHPASKSFPVGSVRSFKMPVCPLFVLYEVSGNSPRVHVIPSDVRVVEVGRSPDCTLYSSNPSVSQHHFRFVITPGGTNSNKPEYTVEIEDCGSRNGTWVNHEKQQADARRLMRDGDIIEAASSRYLFYYILRPR